MNEILIKQRFTRVPYIEAIIHEASRLYPISALAAPRRVLKDTVLDGYTIPAVTMIDLVN